MKKLKYKFLYEFAALQHIKYGFEIKPHFFFLEVNTLSIQVLNNLLLGNLIFTMKSRISL